MTMNDNNSRMQLRSQSSSQAVSIASQRRNTSYRNSQEGSEEGWTPVENRNRSSQRNQRHLSSPESQSSASGSSPSQRQNQRGKRQRTSKTNLGSTQNTSSTVVDALEPENVTNLQTSRDPTVTALEDTDFTIPIKALRSKHQDNHYVKFNLIKLDKKHLIIVNKIPINLILELEVQLEQIYKRYQEY